MDFKSEHSFEKRLIESQRIVSKYPDRVPIIIQPGKKDIPALDKCKYLVPHDLTMSQFLYVVRKKIPLQSSEQIFIFTADQKLPSTSHLLSQIYKEHKDKDGFLYLTYLKENTFGLSTKQIV